MDEQLNYKFYLKLMGGALGILIMSIIVGQLIGSYLIKKTTKNKPAITTIANGNTSELKNELEEKTQIKTEEAQTNNTTKTKKTDNNSQTEFEQDNSKPNISVDISADTKSQNQPEIKKNNEQTKVNIINTVKKEDKKPETKNNPTTLPEENNSDTNSTPLKTKYYKIQAGIFSSEENAKKMADELQAKGEKVNLVKIKNGDQVFYRIQLGAYTNKENALKKTQQLKDRGIEAIIKEED